MAEQEQIRVTKNLKGFHQESNSHHPSSGLSSSSTSTFGSSDNVSRRRRIGSSGEALDQAAVAGPSTSSGRASGNRKRSRSGSKKKKSAQPSKRPSKKLEEQEESEDQDEVEEEEASTSRRRRSKPTPAAPGPSSRRGRKKIRLTSASPTRSAGEEAEEEEVAPTSGRSSRNTTRKQKEERPNSRSAKSSTSRGRKGANSANSSPTRRQSATVESEEEVEETPRYPLRGRLATQQRAALSKAKTQPKPAQKRGAAAPAESSSEEDSVEEPTTDVEPEREESEVDQEAKDTSSASESEESKPSPKRAKRAKKDKTKKRKKKSSPSKKSKRRGTSSSNVNTGTCASSSRGRASRTGGTGSGGVVSTGPGGGPSSDQPQQPAPDQAGPSSSSADDSAPGPSSAMNSSGGGLGSLFGGSSSGAAAAGASGGGEDSEMGRLQALLESRGVPAHLFGALAPRVQNLIQRSIGATKDVCKAQQLLNSLQSSTDQSTQLQILIELCQLLVMGNEETLSGFPVKQAVPTLITLLNVENNFEIMHHACRALTYMMEALPRSSSYVVDAIPSFLEKVQVIQCMDVAEQSLSALDSLSRKHAKSILNARGVAACLMYLDFFSINAQRCALNIAANCCQVLHPEDFDMVSGSLGLLVSRLTHQDRRSVESVCLGLSRLVENCQSHPRLLKQIGSKELLKNLQQLLVVSPPVVSQGTFIMIVRLLAVMCGACPEVAVELMRENIVETLSYLLTGSGQSKNSEEVELLSRSPQELFEIVSLIAELMPTLPETEPLFSVDAWMMKPVVPIAGRVSSAFLAIAALSGASAASAEVASTSGLSVASTSGTVGGSARRDGSVVTWQWRHDDGTWHNYSAVDSGILEDAYLQGEDEISLSTAGRSYTVDFQAMQQINEDTGTARNIMRRRVAPEDVVDNVDALSAGSFSATSLISCGNDPDAPGVGPVVKTENEASAREDARAKLLVEEQEVAIKFMTSLFGIVYQVYSSSAGPAVKHKCLRALLRMVYFASPELLKNVLKPQEVSSQLAGMLSSTDLKVLAGALQLASIFLQKLPHLFGIHFRREGVLFRVQNLKKGIGLGSTSSSSSVTNTGSTGGNNNNNAAQQQQQQQQRRAGQSAGHGQSGSSSKKHRKRGSSNTAPSGSVLLPSNNAGGRHSGGSSRNGPATSGPLVAPPPASQLPPPTSVPPNLASAMNFFAQTYSNAAGDYNMAPAPPAYPHDLSQAPPPPLPSSAPPSLNGNEVAGSGFAPFPPLPPPPGLGPGNGPSAILSVLPPPPPAAGPGMPPVGRHPLINSGSVQFRMPSSSAVSCSDVSPMFRAPNWLSPDYRSPLAMVPPPAPPAQSHPALQHMHQHAMNSPAASHSNVALLPSQQPVGASAQYGSQRISSSALMTFNEFRALRRAGPDGDGNAGTTTSAASSFLAHLNPSRWARAGSSRSPSQTHAAPGGTSVSAPASVGSSASSIPVAVNGARTSASTSASPAGVGMGTRSRPSSAFYACQAQQPVVSYLSQNKEKIKGWIMERAAQLEKEYEVLTETLNEDQSILDITTVLDDYWKTGIHVEIKIPLSQAGDILSWLSSAVRNLRAARSENECIQSLKTIGAIVKFMDISPFEMTHSELITALLEFLTASDASQMTPPVNGGPDVGNNNENEGEDQKPAAVTYPTEPGPTTSVGGRQGERKRLRGAAGAKVEIKVAPASRDGAHRLPPRMTRMRIFAHVFLGCSLDPLSSKPADSDNALIKCLVPKLIGCLHQVEQFAVRVHDLPGGNGANRSGASAIKFFNTHHLKCNLQRHPDCATLRKWKAGAVKIDPLALVSSVERYMVMKGYGRPRAAGYPDDDIPALGILNRAVAGAGGSSSSGATAAVGGAGGASSSSAAAAAAPQLPSNDDESDEDASDDDLDDAFSVVSQSQGRHKLEFLINGHVLPYNMTVYQAVRQYSHAGSARGGAGGSGTAETSETDTDSEATGNGANLWVQTHTIYYRPYTDPDPQPSQPSSSSSASNVVSGFLSGRCNKSGRSNNQAGNSGGHSKPGKSGKGKGGSNADPVWAEGQVPDMESTLSKIPTDGQLPSYVAVTDASVPVLSLLRAIYIINRHWGDLYAVGHYQPVISTGEFISSKLTAKANRQLQDPLVIMTGNIPPWLHQIAQACPFLFPFDTRQLLFYAVTFDRDRALHRLLEAQPELTTSSTDRVAPRLEKRKRTIGRDDLLKQAETVINDVANSKALLEIEYENEVGTGLGPTLEFYTLISRELQRFDLDLWRGDKGPAQVPYSGHGQVLAGGGKKGHDAAGAVLALHYVKPQGCGLFPTPIGKSVKPNMVAKQRAKFKFMGKLLARAVMDSRMLDLPLNPLMYKWLKGETMDVASLPPIPAFSTTPPPNRGNKSKGAAKNVPILAPSFADADMAVLDPDLARTYYQLLAVVQKKERLEAQKKEKIAAAGGAPDEPGSPKITSLDEIKEDSDDGVMDFDSIEDLGLDFTLPGHPSIELRKGGKDIPVTIQNLKQYLKLVRHWCLVEGVARQMDALREGFESVFPPGCLNLFFPEEMELLCCGGAGTGGAKWDLRTLMDCCRPDHGYTHDSRAVRWFFEILSTYDVDEQRRFLQFVTGSPCLPVGGFKSLSPPLTVVRKTMDVGENPDEFLPSVMTCVNYLKLPDYTTMEIMREKLRVAAMEGQYSFHLS